MNPTVRHADILARMLTYVGTGANLVNDAHLAALAVEHRASIVSYDSDGIIRPRASTLTAAVDVWGSSAVVVCQVGKKMRLPGWVV